MAGRLRQRNGVAVELGSRSLDPLITLVERPVSRRELIARAWPRLMVDEANLRVNIANLRNYLGEGAAARATSSTSHPLTQILRAQLTCSRSIASDCFEGEHVHILPLLDVPPISERMTASDAMALPAVQPSML